MTTVAYRAGVMAADSERSFGGFVTHDAVKVHRVGARLYGFSGNATIAAEALRRLREQGPEAEWPHVDVDDQGGSDLVTLVYGADCGLLRRGGRGDEPINMEYFAVGADADVAIGALHAGACAAGAVRAAIEHGVHSGGRVVIVSLHQD